MDAAEDLGTIQADTRKVKQIVYNLLSNAVKFTGESGHVTLHAGRVHEVLNATDAEAGLTLAREKQPDLILMVIQLPGMDGLAATALLKKDDATRAIPVIALTALAMKGDEERIRAAGCDGIRPCRRLVVRHVGARVHLRARGSGPMATR